MNRIKESTRKTDCRWLNLFHVSWIDGSGRTRGWEVATRRPEPRCVSGEFDHPDAVVIVAYHIGLQKMVVTREYRVPLADVEYGFPAGLVDPAETVEQASKRELKEETGLEVIRFLAIGPPVYSSAGMTDESVSMVWLECDGTPTDAGNMGAEEIEVLLVTPDEAGRLCRDRSIKFDAKAWLVLSAYADSGGKRIRGPSFS